MHATSRGFRQWYRLSLAGALLCGATAVLLQHSKAEAQSGSRQGSGVRQARPMARRPFEDRLWSWLQAVQYRHWGPMPGQSTGTIPGKSPHGDFVKMYANRSAVQGMEDRAIIIKENYGPDGETLMAITLMYKIKDYDPENGDWYWAKYDADGRPSQMEGQPLVGRVQACIQCHAAAEGGDQVFANDAP